MYERDQMTAELTAYELERLENIKRNEEMLRQLGLASQAGATLLGTVASAAPSKRKGPPPLSDQQRETLTNSSGWLERFEVWLREDVSQANADKVMERVRDLVSGRGVQLSGVGAPVAFEGRAITISDDLVTLRAEAAARYGIKGNGRDAGGWFLSHPLGKLLKFQVELYSASPENPAAGDGITSVSSRSSSTAIVPVLDTSWLVAGAQVEVEMREEGLFGSRYGATVVAVDGREATVRYTHLLTGEGESEALVEQVNAAALRPCPPRAIGFASTLRRGSICELYHNDGWWQVRVAERHKRKPAVAGGKTPAARYEVYSETYGEIDATVPASQLRPRFALLSGSEWLALAPVGQKCGLTEAEMVVGEEEEEVTEEEMAAEKAAAEAKRDAARTERLAAQEARAKAQAKAKAERQAAKERLAAARQAKRAAAAAEKQAAQEERMKRAAEKRRAQGKRQKTGASPAEAEAEAGAEAEAACHVCARSSSRKRREIARTWIEGNWLLLCDGDGCNKAYHTLCLRPKLDAVPEGDWLCPTCAPKDAECHAHEEDERGRAAACLPRAESLRSYIFYALCAGMAERDDILAHMSKTPGHRYARCDVVTVLGKEKARAAAAAATPALWVQDGSRYALTIKGEELAREVKQTNCVG